MLRRFEIRELSPPDAVTTPTLNWPYITQVTHVNIFLVL